MSDLEDTNESFRIIVNFEVLNGMCWFDFELCIARMHSFNANNDLLMWAASFCRTCWLF